MQTPICDFVRRYAQLDALRLHMPGHKGHETLGMERLDITEIDGADSLYEADGIIRRSEENAGELFDAHSVYSTEGSSLCIRSMLFLTALYARQTGKRLTVAAGRNAHRSFLTACALLDIDVVWLFPQTPESYLSCGVQPRQLERCLMQERPVAVYLTSPDYLGATEQLTMAAALCHSHGALLLVDNAHGAYLKFLPQSQHPIDLGADACCDSAHKTLPVLTGGAYLHISRHAPACFAEQAKGAMAMFGSTSPSYLILQSLDAANAYLAGAFRQELAEFIGQVQLLKQVLTEHGYRLYGNEPLKLTICAKPFGYTGTELAQALKERRVICEFADPDYTVMMLTPQLGVQGLHRLQQALLSLARRPAILQKPPVFARPQRVLSVRQAAFSPREPINAQAALGRVLAEQSLGCPPAVPIVVCGERIDSHALECFAYYGIDRCTVIKEL